MKRTELGLLALMMSVAWWELELDGEGERGRGRDGEEEGVNVENDMTR